MKTNIYSNASLIMGICILCAGLMIHSVVSAVTLSDNKEIVGTLNNDATNDNPEWWPENTTTKKVKEALVHKIVRGDCVYNLAKKYGVTIKQITDWNKLANPNKIEVKAELIVGYEEKTIVVEEEIKIPQGFELKRIEDVKQLSLSINLNYFNRTDLFTTIRKQEFPFYISEYVKSYDGQDEQSYYSNLASKNTFINSKNLSFFEKLDAVGIKYNTVDNQQYSIQEVAESTIGKLIHQMGGNFIYSSGKLLADCGDYRALLISAWTGKKIKDITTSSIFNNAKNFNPDQIEIGTEVGWTSFISKKTGKKIFGHVYVYIGDGQFANLSSKRKGVFFASLQKMQELSKIYNMKMTA